ncbi:protein phosphatase methylesterase [Suillus plorans]|uniref:Protein phosphatase methylesterase 1 n=1 Tax=Suillus plorans TaxID=116603 RepID=A0A9P7DLE8_9AGAM|nr:protein phosphatase methylesterase [Suillus plorans]KAG1797755.1 protein phosphatase methylesterase [Suillus plorans]
MPRTALLSHPRLAGHIGELSTGMGPPPLYPPNPEFNPLSPASYLSQALQISLPNQALDVRVYYTPLKYEYGCFIVFHHGAGYAGTSFACLTKVIAEVTRDNVGVLAFDARRHGMYSPQVFAEYYFQGIQHHLSLIMHAILNSRPEGYSVQEAIKWHVNTGLIHNPISARLSIPSIIVPADSPLTPSTRANIGFKYKWCWFPSLSSLFLGLSYARLLVLAGAERLDTTLTVSRMQGKFWLKVMAGSGVGHLVHKDGPTKLAEILADFWRRNERIVIRGNVIKMVGEV